MKYNRTKLPDEAKELLEEITKSEPLNDSFCECDIEIFDQDEILEMEEDDEWLEDLMGPGEATYEEIRPFARDGSGAVWVVLDGAAVGYIGTEGECGLVARNFHEFVNMVAVWRSYLFDFWDADILESFEDFLEAYEDEERFEVLTDKARTDKAFDKLIAKYNFTTDLRDIYHLVIKGMTAEPFFEIKATDDDYCDSYSLLGSDDGQEALEELIESLKD
ncbi:MAG: hypothetical protein J5825_05555 [Lachnospiraceae bacterium]|nr:hypothetical protein [Lachnospiraceae bacterium]